MFITFAAAGVVVPPTTIVGPANFQRYMRFTLPKGTVTGGAAHVVAAVNITHNDLRLTSSGGQIVNSLAWDLAFYRLTTAKAWVKIPHDLLTYNGTTGAITSNVRIDTVVDADGGARWYLWWGDSGITVPQEDPAGTDTAGADDYIDTDLTFALQASPIYARGATLEADAPHLAVEVEAGGNVDFDVLDEFVGASLTSAGTPSSGTASISVDNQVHYNVPLTVPLTPVEWAYTMQGASGVTDTGRLRVTVLPAGGTNESWSPIALPIIANYSGSPRKFQFHRTGWITQDTLDRNQNTTKEGVLVYRRLSIDTSGASDVLVNTVTTGLEVQPIGFTKVWQLLSTSYRAISLRYERRITRHRGWDGKIMYLGGGLGMIGKGYNHTDTAGQPKDTAIWGTGGWGSNGMTPMIGGNQTSGSNTNYERLMCSDVSLDLIGADASFGITASDDNSATLVNTWQTIDQFVDMQKGHRLLRDGDQIAHTSRPVMNPADGIAKTIEFIIRLMHGGEPQDKLAKWNYEERYRNFEIWIWP